MRKQQTLSSTRRYYMWWSEGKKDGMCSLYRDVGQIPKIYREAYNSGHTYGMLLREGIYEHVV